MENTTGNSGQFLPNPNELEDEELHKVLLFFFSFPRIYETSFYYYDRHVSLNLPYQG